MSHTAVHKRKNTPLWSPFVVGVFPLSLIRGGKRGNDQEVTGPYVSVLTTPLCTQHSSRYQPPLPPLPFPHDRQRKTVKLTLSNNNTLRKTPAKPFRIRPLYVFSVLPISHAHSFSPPYPFSSITHLGSATHFLSPIHKESGRELPRKKSHSAPAPTEGMFEFVDDGLDPSGKISNANLTILIVDQGPFLIINKARWTRAGDAMNESAGRKIDKGVCFYFRLVTFFLLCFRSWSSKF